MTGQTRDLFPAKYLSAPLSHRLRDAVVFASLWATALGLLIGWGSYTATESGFWHIVFVLTVSNLAGGLIPHTIFEGSGGLPPATLAGAVCGLLYGLVVKINPRK